MSVRLIAGRAGAGKTAWCQSQIIAELADSLVDGPRLVMLVPEQAGLQMERSLLAASASRALGRCDVLSFRRLAGRIFNESAGLVPLPLSATGRQMALRFLLAKHRRSLQEFGRVSQRGGFVTQIARGIAELLQEAVSVEQLAAAAAAATEAKDPAAPRLHDVALLYRAYLDYLGDDRVDPEAVLDLARSRLPDAAWLRDARIWIDGFAGLTQQQLRMIVALAKAASHIDVALLLDPAAPSTQRVEAQTEDYSLFARTEGTWANLSRALLAEGVAIQPPLKFDAPDRRRFAAAPTLAQLEQRLFVAPPVTDESVPASQHATEKTHPAVRLVQARDRRTEVQAAVRTILDLVQRPVQPLRYRDIAVIVRDLAPYHDLISARLAAHDIPFFIDRRRPTHHHPLIQFIRAAVGLMADAALDESIVMLLKTGLSGLPDDDVDLLENHCLAHGRTTPESWDRPWTASSPLPNTALAHEQHAVEQARRTLRERFADWWPSPGRRGRPKCRTWAQRLSALLQRFAVADQLAHWSALAEAAGDLDEAAEHERVWSDFVKLLDEMVAALGEDQMTGRQFRDILESALADFTLGLVPATIDQVLVGSIERSRHPAIRAALLLGFADGNFPARITEDSIFGDPERALLQQHNTALGRTSKQRLLDERMLAYVAVTRPSEFLWVSYPQSDEAGRSLAPSPYWPWLRAALPDIQVETARTDEPPAIGTAGDLAGGLAMHLREWATERLNDSLAAGWLALYHWTRTRAEAPIRAAVARALSAFSPAQQATIPPDAVKALWPAPYRTSVTRLETFAQCPFRHFVAYGLRLSERAVHEVSSIHWGRFYHQVLEQFVNEMIETGTTLRDLSPADIAQRLDNVCNHVLPAFVEELNLAEAEQKKVKWRSKLELPAAVEGQQTTLGKTPLRPEMTERQFGDNQDDGLPALELTTPSGQRILVRGKIDRVDLLQVGEQSLAVVFDYKRAIGRRLNLDEVYHGLALQLLAYLLVLRDQGGGSAGARIVPGGAFYLPLLGQYKRLEHPAEADKEGFDPLDAFKPRGIVNFDWIDRLDTKGGSKWSSIFSVYRKKDGSMGNVNTSDAVGAGSLPRLLDHVRNKMTELAAAWLDGDIRVRPARLGDDLPCTHCPYRGVCRYEYAPDQARGLASMSRSEVLEKIAQGPTRPPDSGDADG